MSLSFAALVTCAALPVALSATATRPLSVEEHIRRGQAALADLEYEIAADELMIAASDPAASDEQRLRANLQAGIANRVLGRDVEARLNFHYVLSRQPAAQLPPDTAPKIRSFFELVRQEILDGRSSALAAASAPAVPPQPADRSAAPETRAGSMAWLLGTGGGATLLVLGAAATAIGSWPYLAHMIARSQLQEAASAGTDGAKLQAEQTRQRAAWESWGAPTASVGFIAVGLGAALAAASVALLRPATAAETP